MVVLSDKLIDVGLAKNIRKRKKSGGKRRKYRHVRRYEKRGTFTNTKLSQDKKIKIIRVRGGNYKRRLLRTNNGFFTWGSKGVTRKSRIIAVAYSSSSIEFIRTRTLVRGMVVLVDISPFRRWYEREYNEPLARLKTTEIISEEDLTEEDRADIRECQSRVAAKQHLLEPEFEKLAVKGKALAILTSRPGQCGQVNGRILEGQELAFYEKVLQRKRLIN